MMEELVPSPGTRIFATFSPVARLILSFIIMTSEFKQIRALYAPIKDTDKKFADLNGALMDNSLQAAAMIICSAFGTLTQGCEEDFLLKDTPLEMCHSQSSALLTTRQQ